MKRFALILSFALLSGCGTVTTLTSSDSEIARDLRQKNSGCVSMPRVYSGVAYNMCKLNSNGTSIYFAPLLGVYLVDSVFSAATDTVVLPYTIYAQNEQGSVNL
ncbi:YceK/YidQ family lipoprotein [Microbulbifer elongatus]|uniref:YceK/YidQ family lipoprotein n=1 Tax=Microbulbifer elongatus TaxID=86173 RepID=A0ABT1P265_9GAMM|nr:YceK/YidQ family lipoprotein [Microbulbifer elongatus]MCQ3829592.1 YceK/YidQ family lipoprotein [Microbulbifer elongatus]